MKTLRIASIAATLLAFTLTLSGCLVAGYSSGSGFFVWPGSIILTLVAVLIFFLMRRGR